MKSKQNKSTREKIIKIGLNADPNVSVRIAKRLARAGLCSRREAERWVIAGRVKVDGLVLDSPAVNVTPKSKIEVDGNPLVAAETTKLWRYYKPRGLLTTNYDPEGRPTVFDQLPDTMPRVLTIGRLDLNTEGLLLLTNNGELARYLELPSTGWSRRYRVRVHGSVDEKAFSKLSTGLMIEGIAYRGIDAKIDSRKGANTWLTLTLKEGKNREIRRIMEYLNLQVSRLIRISYGPFQLGELDKGNVANIPHRILSDQLGSLDLDFRGQTSIVKTKRPNKI